MLYCHAFKKWLIWDGRRWKVDHSERARTLSADTMIEFLRQSVAEHNEPASKFARKSLDSNRISNMLRESQARLAVSPAELDQHPFALNFLNGTVDLQTGELRPPRPEDRLTKVVHFDYRPEAKCPRFLSVLATWMGAHLDASEPEHDRVDRMIAYLQRAIGYSLTGSTREKVVFMLFGRSNNGKTTFLDLFRGLIEEYAVLLQIDTLMIRQESNNSQADLADLRGARFVMTSETEEGQRLAAGKLKRITQGMGKIKAVRKYENPIEFLETHKLWMDANHKPIVPANDTAIWRRLHPIPFAVTITEIDRGLPAKLKGEAEGILAWAVAGAVMWAKNGLGRPPEIEAATAEYRTEMDQIGRFIEESCVTLPTATTKGRQLYLAYKTWCEQAGEENVVSETVLGKQMLEHNFEKKHGESGVIYRGIGLRTNSNADRS
jgi:putative DNA primase/helicase